MNYHDVEAGRVYEVIVEYPGVLRGDCANGHYDLNRSDLIVVDKIDSRPLTSWVYFYNVKGEYMRDPISVFIQHTKPTK